MWEAFISTFVPELPFSCVSLQNATLQFSQLIGFILWVKSLMLLQVTWTWVAFFTCYTTVWFLSSVFSHVPSSHLYVTRSCHTACNRVAILQYGSPSGSSCDQTMRKTWPRFCTWMTSHLCELFFGAPNSIAFTKHFWHITCFSIVWAISCLLNISDVKRFLSKLITLNAFSTV